MNKRIAQKNSSDRIAELETQNNLLLKEVELLRKEKSRLDYLALDLSIGVISTDENYSITHFNNALYDIFQIPKSENLVGKDICYAFDLVSQQIHNRDKYLIRLQSVLYNKKPINSHILKLKDDRILDLKFTPIIESNILNSTIIIIRDITALYNIADSNSINKIWQLAIEGSNEGVWDWNLTNNQVYYSPKWKKMLGFDSHEIKNHIKEWESRVHPDDMQETLKAIKKHINGETEYYESTHRVRCKDNSYKWILDRGKIISYDAAGNPIKMVGTHTDITEKKIAEEKLKEVNNQLQQERLLFMQGNVLIFKIKNQASLPIEYVSPNIDLMLGYTESDVYTPSFSFRRIIHKDDLKKRFGEGAISKIHQTDTSFNNAPYRLVRKDGKIIWVYEYTQIIRNKKGNISGYTGYLVEVTDMIKARVKLLESQKELKQLNETKDKILSIIAHDLKGSFNSLIGFSDIILDNIENDDFKNLERFTQIIHNTSNRTYLLFVNLLNWVKKQSQKIELNIQKLQTDELIIEALDASKHLAREKLVNIISDSQKDLKFEGDKNMINTVLRNTISNAIKYVDKNGIIRVNVKQVNKHIEFSIIDNGVGIPPENIDKLFNEKSGITTLGTNYEKGTGLGLIICKAFIKQHGGKIWATSEVNIGTTITFTIPVNAVNKKEKTVPKTDNIVCLQKK